VPAPELPEDIAFSDLDRAVRARLRTLSKENAENVGLHLVMTGRLLDSDPELAYEHAQAAVRRAGRVDVVREAAGLAAYRTGRFAEALRELRTVRRLNGSSEHLAVMADCERGLGRPERALALASSPEAEGLEPADALELAIVVSGARIDLGEPEAAIAVLRSPAVRAASGVVAVRVAQALAAAYEAAGRPDEAAQAVAGYTAAQLDEASGGVDEEEDDVVVFDLADDVEGEAASDGDADEAASDGHVDDGAADGSVDAGAADAAGVEGDPADDDDAAVEDTVVADGSDVAQTSPVEPAQDGPDVDTVAGPDGADADHRSEA
jgi:tetratricopeptide (TPR) repeat protein